MKRLLTLVCLLWASNVYAQEGSLIQTFDSGPIIASVIPSNSSHALGTSIGGLMSVPIARKPGFSGIITSILYKSVGGDTGLKVGRIWARNPVNTTCTDNLAFAGSDTDDIYLIGPGPFSFTPAAPGVTTGDSSTYASLTGLTWDFANFDITTLISGYTRNVYICIVTGATDTADQNKTVRITLSGPQN